MSSSLAEKLPVGPGDLDTRFGHRRAARRYPLHADVQVVEPRSVAGVTLNASAGGMRVALQNGLTVGELCTIRVSTAPGRETLEHMRVVWSRELPDGWLLGLAFVQLS